MISTERLAYAYNGNRIFRYPDLHCRQGEKLLIHGRSGSGKTTLLHLLSGVLQPTEGVVSVNGQDLGKLSDAAMDRFRGQHIGIIPQKFHFIASVSVEDNIRAAAYFAGKKSDPGSLTQITDTLGIGHLLKRKPASLSLGEQQRVCIARAIINAPAVLLADEPTSSLDDDNCKEVLELLDAACHFHRSALIIVTHDDRVKATITQNILLS